MMGFSTTRGIAAIRRRRAWAVAALAAALTATGLAVTTATGLAVTGTVPDAPKAHAQPCSTANPPANAADPITLSWSSNEAIQTNFTNARRAEGCPPLTLPPGYDNMTPQEQMLSLFNSERTVRGLPDLRLDRTLLSQIALNHNREMVEYEYFDHSSPVNLGLAFFGGRLTVNEVLAPPKVTATGENIAAGSRNSAEAVYSFMYFDGPGARNGACTPTDSSGCWGHRKTILGSFNWVGIGVTLNAVGSQWTNYYTADFVTAPDYTPPAKADTAPPLMGQISYSGGTATVIGVADNPGDGSSMGPNPDTAGITQVVFYVNRISRRTGGGFNTVVAAQAAPRSGTWTASIAVSPGDVLHAVAVDGSGNFIDRQLALLPQGL